MPGRDRRRVVRRDARRSTLIPPGGSAVFLAPLPTTELAQPGEDRGELVDLLRRLGLETLGDFAAFAERDIAGRFPQDAITAHRRARGLSQKPPLRCALRCRPPPPRSGAACGSCRRGQCG